MILFLKEITSYFHEEHVTLVIVKKKKKLTSYSLKMK